MARNKIKKKANQSQFFIHKTTVWLTDNFHQTVYLHKRHQIHFVTTNETAFSTQQSIIQTVEADTPFLLQIVNTQIEAVFGPTKSFFIETTPRKFLFEGIEFCKSPIGLAGVVCSSVEERNSPSIVKSADGTALKFSMFNHVNFQ